MTERWTWDCGCVIKSSSFGIGIDYRGCNIPEVIKVALDPDPLGEQNLHISRSLAEKGKATYEVLDD